MNYNTETINHMAHELAEMFKSAVIAQQESKGRISRIAQIEADMREALRQIGNQALGLFLSSMQTTPEKEIACPCGGRLHYQRMREAMVISVFGRTFYERAYYAGCQCRQGKAPLDEQFGLQPGAVTAGLATLLALAGIEFSYDKSPQWLQAYLLFDISENTVRTETERMGTLQAKREEVLIRESQDERYLQRRQRNPGRIAPRLYGSIDAAKVRIEPRPKQGEEKETHEDWRDMKMLCWFETEPVPPSQRSKRQRKKAEREQPALRARETCSTSVISPKQKSLENYCGLQAARSMPICVRIWFSWAMGLSGSGIWLPTTIPRPNKSWTGIMPKNILKLWLLLLFPT
jgi:hypothetical protein